MRYDQGLKKDEVVVLDVSDHEFEQMIEFDYRERLAEAAEGENVYRRLPQEILDDINEEDFKSWRKHNRRLVNRKSKNEETAELDMMDLTVDDTQRQSHQREEGYEELCQKIRSRLTPRQAEMIIAIYLDGMRICDYAEEMGDKPNNVMHRIKRAKKLLKENLF